MSMIQQAKEDGEIESPDGNLIEGSRREIAQLTVQSEHFAETNHQMFTRSMSLPENKNSSQNDYSAENLGALPIGIHHSDSSGEIKATTIAKIEHIKNWSISTYKCTKQFISEKLGKTSRTVDTELESQIDSLRDVQRKYLHILRLSRALSSHFQQVNATFQGLGEAFAELAQKSPELQQEFLCNAETQRSLSRHGIQLEAALNFFVSSVNTLVNKTMEDTLITVKRYEAARIEYDAYRHEYETLLQSGTAQCSAVAEAQKAHDDQKVEFEKLRADVNVKLRFLNENRVKVMHKQLLLFHNAVNAFFSGNGTALEATMKQFNIKLKTGNNVQSSWLEQ